ncbi:glycosyltransferase family 2 protein [Desulfosarcina sp. OttesenSCG-928-A07]|nr:glycosyltransferase family 2 protein [Desulfosarcina sp. OttesenSCG-928-G17]MDL2329297.1 glycosyltransferase family 2 protein [Desulfosarcina sp. OttesenSCG-928-A07]
MLIDVVIVNFNSGPWLAKCLNHLRCQTTRPNTIYVVDNASQDGSDVIPDPPDNLVVIKMPVNVGFAAGNNCALKASTAPYIALLNPDAFPEPDWLEALLRAAEDHPDMDFFGSRQVCAENPEILDGIGDVFHVSSLAWRNGHGRRQEPADLVEREIFSPCAAAALYRREALDQVGGFDEDYFCYFEDVDLGFRLRLCGYKALYVPDAVVHHLGSATTGGQRSDFSVYHGHRNRIWTYVKNMPGIWFWIFLPLHGIANFLVLLLYVFRGKARTILRSNKDAVKGLGKMWAKRCAIQRSRVATCADILKIVEFKVCAAKKQGRAKKQDKGR